MINITEKIKLADEADFDVGCAVNGNIILKEYTFAYSVSQWDPRVMN